MSNTFFSYIDHCQDVGALRSILLLHRLGLSSELFQYWVNVRVSGRLAEISLVLSSFLEKAADSLSLRSGGIFHTFLNALYERHTSTIMLHLDMHAAPRY